MNRLGEGLAHTSSAAKTSASVLTRGSDFHLVSNGKATASRCVAVVDPASTLARRPPRLCMDFARDGERHGAFPRTLGGIWSAHDPSRGEKDGDKKPSSAVVNCNAAS
jgi:hypothetical protein